MQPAGRAGVPSGLHTSSRHLGDSICLCARSLTLSAAPALDLLDGERARRAMRRIINYVGSRDNYYYSISRLHSLRIEPREQMMPFEIYYLSPFRL